MPAQQDAAGVFDYVVVGAGSAGCVLAARLSEDANVSVLLVEAGGRDTSPLFTVPGGQAFIKDWRRYAWLYDIERDGSRLSRTEVWRRGRILGGSSTINGLIWAWGLPRDFDAWAARGLPGWSWDRVVPYFRKSETYHSTQTAGHDMRGTSGPIQVETFRSPHAVIPDLIRACGSVGMPLAHDINAVSWPAIGHVQTNQRHGIRQSSARAYLGPARGRRNLSIWTQCRTTGIQIEDGVARGVQVVRDGTELSIRARREVILCAGAIASPQLLMLSGIGPAAHLTALGIEVKVDSPQIGRNLHDHPELYVEYQVAARTYSRGKSPMAVASAALQYMMGRKGPATSPGTHALGYARSGVSPGPEADILLFCGPWGQLSGTDPFKRGLEVFSLSPSVCKPRSRGTVTLRSHDPLAPPKINANLLGDGFDVTILREGIRMLDRIASAEPMRRHVIRRLTLPDGLDNDRRVDDYVRSATGICYHACGTCRMGADPDSALDPALRVRGVGGLRVVDASVMPEITSGNLNAPTVMIAEVAADLIRRG